ncbi:hypothetical protein DM02DRAFT_715272 [Periconia macrospinosa]|uniref:Impact N-terminal domain-containing protein n=1 Tax=Periconia macrospinosa TaxID=97972 RepID=A0A2V1E6H5_9PLEO|nr:hypothetical protein DM02DRAFT_715272 [Periconia macrospinosa]
MASAQEIQTLLRFLSQDAKVPLAQAMGKIKDLQSAKLITPAEIAKSEFDHLKTLFSDDKLARQVLNAAKRVSKKRTSSEASISTAIVPSPVKRAKPSHGMAMDPETYEASLALPEVMVDVDTLRATTIFTNRAPLILAFAVTLLKYTMPEQPTSSRLSLAQAVCSANSQSKAKYIGIHKGRTAEEEGWGEGQPVITVMGRQIRVMKRWGYEWRGTKIKEEVKEELESTQDTLLADTQATQPRNDHPSLKRILTDETLVQDPLDISQSEEEPALWGVDLEALKRSNGPVVPGMRNDSATELPIYKPESTRAYLLKSFDQKTEGAATSNTKKKKPAVEKERNLGLLLRALEHLCESWNGTINKEELDKKAWSWYANVRPEVKAGAAGWGGKGNVSLADILELRRPAT